MAGLPEYCAPAQILAGGLRGLAKSDRWTLIGFVIAAALRRLSTTIVNAKTPIPETGNSARLPSCGCGSEGARLGLLGILPSILLAIAPKCPFCWAAYMSALGSLGISIQLPFQPWLLPLLTGLLAVNLVALLLRARSRGRFGPFYLCLLGGAIIVGGKFAIESAPMMALGLACILAGSCWNATLRPRRN
jgi:hypothetical protein